MWSTARILRLAMTQTLFVPCVFLCVCLVWLQDGYEMLPQCPVLVDSECGPCLPTLFVNYLRVIGMLAVVANL